LLKKTYDCFGLDRDEDFVELLWGMLDFNPIRRMSPEEILSHPFM
jgi:serine/threonine protein kinase